MQSTTLPRSPKGDVSYHERGSPLGDQGGAVGDMHHGASGQLFSNAREVKKSRNPR